jgi:hypothetical protein
VVEHFIGNEEVDSSILSGSTILLIADSLTFAAPGGILAGAMSLFGANIVAGTDRENRVS